MCVRWTCSLRKSIDGLSAQARPREGKFLQRLSIKFRCCSKKSISCLFCCLGGWWAWWGCFTKPEPSFGFNIINLFSRRLGECEAKKSCRDCKTDLSHWQENVEAFTDFRQKQNESKVGYSCLILSWSNGSCRNPMHQRQLCFERCLKDIINFIERKI